MSETHSVEIGFDNASWAALEEEVARLGIDAPQLISRATCAWLAEMTDNAALVGVRQSASAE
jgi:hypothetical protein